MKDFVNLYRALDSTTRTGEKVSALEAYFRPVSAEDGAWAVHFLSGERLRRIVRPADLRTFAARAAGLPLWLVEESYDAVGDLAETLALLIPEGPHREPAGAPPGALSGPTEPPGSLADAVERHLQPLAELEPQAQEEALVRLWRSVDEGSRLVLNKLLTGGLRVGVSGKLLIRALARVSGVESTVLAHRLAGAWTPSPQAYRELMDPRARADDRPSQPYPLCLAHPLEADPGTLGSPRDWAAEWKWDGIRGQLIRRAGEAFLWSRGEELISAQFPEILEAAGALPDGVVLDGEVLVWDPGAPAPRDFGALQRRLGRKRVGKKIRASFPAAFNAYDLLEYEGEDLRNRPHRVRRELLEQVVSGEGSPVLRLSPMLAFQGWEELAGLRDRARERGVEGLMLKGAESRYETGRVRGAWWKWKVDPLELDAVLLYAQRGHGKRASLYTDYTFGVWDGGELVPVAKAYTGLTDAEIRDVDRWIRSHIVDRFGPVRAVEPGLVFQLAFDGIRASTRHRAGLALRFPRMVRWRRDKGPESADTLDRARALLERSGPDARPAQDPDPGEDP